VIDFGDGEKSSPLTKESASHISHQYSKPGLYRALLQDTDCAPSPWTRHFVEIVVSSPGPGPALISIAPSEGTIGTKVTVSGSGLRVPDAEILIDGNAVVDKPFPLSIVSDSSLAFSIPSRMMVPTFSCGSGSHSVPVRGPSYPGWVRPGRLGISVRSANGSSNSVYFNLLGEAQIDRDSPPPATGVSTNTQATGTPTITGTTRGLSSINLSFVKLLTDKRKGRYRLDSPIPVVNGHWSIQLTRQKSWGDDNPLPLQPGTYAISVYDVRTGFPLDTVYLNITRP
jgi:hypothetical protein